MARLASAYEMKVIAAGRRPLADPGAEIPNAFLIAIAGGRNVIAVSTALLLAPALGAGIALGDVNTPYATFVILAALSGFGGGNFASSMSNISFFFPKRVQGTALGLNAGLGNLGVSIMQVALPFAMTFSIFGAMGGEGLPLPRAAMTGRSRSWWRRFVTAKSMRCSLLE